MNLNRMVGDIGVGGLGIASPSPLGVLGAAWPQPPGTSSQTSRPRTTYCVIALASSTVRIQHFFGCTFDFSNLHFLEPPIRKSAMAPANRNHIRSRSRLDFAPGVLAICPCQVRHPSFFGRNKNLVCSFGCAAREQRFHIGQRGDGPPNHALRPAALLVVIAHSRCRWCSPPGCCRLATPARSGAW
jgi:hypothetical protein